MERMQNDRIAKSFYVGECAGSRSMGRLRKRWIDTVKHCLKKRSLDGRHAMRMVHDTGVYGVVCGRGMHGA